MSRPKVLLLLLEEILSHRDRFLPEGSHSSQLVVDIFQLLLPSLFDLEAIIYFFLLFVKLSIFSLK